MGNTNLDGFLNRKKADSEFISLADGESCRIVLLREIKTLIKAGYNGGEEKEVLRLICDVETTEGLKMKKFDNGTKKFAQQLIDKGVDVGCTFTLTRQGIDLKTTYVISNVGVYQPGGVVAPVAPVTPATTVATVASVPFPSTPVRPVA